MEVLSKVVSAVFVPFILILFEFGVEAIVYEEYEPLDNSELLKWGIPGLKLPHTGDLADFQKEINEYHAMGFRRIYIEANYYFGHPEELYRLLKPLANGTTFLISVVATTTAELKEWLNIGENQQVISLYFSGLQYLYEEDNLFGALPNIRSNAGAGIFSNSEDFAKDLRKLRSFGLSIDKVVLDFSTFLSRDSFHSISPGFTHYYHEFERKLVDESNLDIDVILYYKSYSAQGCAFGFKWGARNNNSVICPHFTFKVNVFKEILDKSEQNFSFLVSLNELQNYESNLIWQKSDHVMIDINLDMNISVGQNLRDILTVDLASALRNTQLHLISFLIHVQEETNSTALNEIISTVAQFSRHFPWQIKSLVLEFPEIFCNYLRSDPKRAKDFLNELNTTELKQAEIVLGFTYCEISTELYQATQLPKPVETFVDYGLLQNMPTDIEELHSTFVNYMIHDNAFGHPKSNNQTVLLEGYWSPSDEGIRTDILGKSVISCYGLKMYWNSIQMWAKELKWRVQVNLSPSENREIVPWFKNVTYYFNPFDKLDHQGRDFISNFQDKCVIPVNSPPRGYFNWTGPAGVTFNLTRPPFVNLKPHWLIGFFQLVHLKFNLIELVIDVDNNPVDILDSLSRLHENVSNKTSTQYKHYINLGGLDQVAPNFTLHVRALMASLSVIGAHVDLTLASKDHYHSFEPEVERLNESITQIQIFGKKVGLVIPYGSGFSPKLRQNLTKIIQRVDYVIVHVDVARSLALKQGDKNETKLMPEDVYEYGRNYFSAAPNYSDFNNIFYDLRGFRFNCERANPKITVMLRLRFPVYPERGGMGIYLQFWKFVDDFSTTFQFPFFVYEAFDDVKYAAVCSSTQLRFGWWTIKELSHAKDPTTYSEHQSVYYHRPTPVPPGNYTEESEEKPSPGINIFEIVGPSSVTIAFLLIALPLLYRIRQKNKIISDMEFNEFLWGQCPMDDDESGTDPIFSERYDAETFEVDKHEWCRETSTELGVGNFGIVYKSLMSRFQGPVAVKAPKHNTGLQSELVQQVRSFLCEIKIMSYVGEHENILKLLGAYTKGATKGMVLVITEYCANGSLLSHLRSISKARSPTSPEVLYNLYRFCHEIASGMEYIRSRNVVHSDLAARNVFLNHNLTCKISDFGLSRQLEKYSLYKKKSTEPLPWAWMPPESLVRMEFTPKSDVWSMGVTYFEVFSLGERPYPTETWNDEFVNKLENGYRLRQPKYATDQVYKEISKCWELEPEDRPTPAHFIPFFHAQKVYGYADVL